MLQHRWCVCVWGGGGGFRMPSSLSSHSSMVSEGFWVAQPNLARPKDQRLEPESLQSLDGG